MHNAPVNGINYYRLKQVDYDGAFEYSGIISAVADIQGVETRVYPNPAVETLRINFSANVGDVVVELIDMNGARVLRRNGTNVNTNDFLELNVTNLSRGNYLLLISTNGIQEKRKIVIRH